MRFVFRNLCKIGVDDLHVDLNFFCKKHDKNFRFSSLWYVISVSMAMTWRFYFDLKYINLDYKIEENNWNDFSFFWNWYFEWFLVVHVEIPLNRSVWCKFPFIELLWGIFRKGVRENLGFWPPPSSCREISVLFVHFM